MKSNYDLAYALIRKAEGGYANRPKKHDPGGETNYGVTKKTYDAYRRGKGLPRQSVMFISQDEVAEIYRQEYAKPVRFDDLPAGVDYFVFDSAIHSGPVRAAKLLQRVVGADEDGFIGAKTLASVAAMPPMQLLSELKEVRMRYLKGLDNWKPNANGWTNRVNHALDNAKRMVSGEVLPQVDYAQCTAEGCAKAWGEQSFAGSIKDSSRSQAAVVGGAAAAAPCAPPRRVYAVAAGSPAAAASRPIDSREPRQPPAARKPAHPGLSGASPAGKGLCFRPAGAERYA